jgi:Zn-dependent protease with chaperone function
VSNADALEAARALLPWWVLWGGLIYVPLAFVAGAVLTGATALAAYRNVKDAHWTERARHVFVTRRVTNFAAAFSCIITMLYVGLWFDGKMGRIPGRPLAFVASAASLTGALFVTRALERQIRGPRPLLVGLRGGATYLLVALPTIVVGWFFACIEPTEMGWQLGAVVAGGLACVVIALYGGGLRLARALGLARPAQARVVSAVQEAARRGGTAVRPVYEIAWQRANAVAFPHLQCLAFTEPAVDGLDDEELCAVAAHELAHLDEPRSIRALRVGMALCLPLGLMLIPASGAAFGALAPLAVIFGLLFVVVVFRRITRRMEERADRAARTQEPGEARIYARALEHLYEVNLMPAVLARKGTHPHLYDRMLAAGVRPSYPRPLPPPRGRFWAMAIAPVGAMVIAFALAAGTFEPAHDEPTLLTQMALTGGDTNQVAVLARLRQKAGDSRAAASFDRARFILADVDVPAKLPTQEEVWDR